jgi:hypothetical protein
MTVLRAQKISAKRVIDRLNNHFLVLIPVVALEQEEID